MLHTTTNHVKISKSKLRTLLYGVRKVYKQTLLYKKRILEVKMGWVHKCIYLFRFIPIYQQRQASFTPIGSYFILCHKGEWTLSMDPSSFMSYILMRQGVAAVLADFQLLLNGKIYEGVDVIWVTYLAFSPRKNLIFLNLSLTNNLHTTDLKTNNVHKANHFSNHKTKQMSKITLETKWTQTGLKIIF